MDILIIKLGAIGDVIRTTSILAGLKEKYPDCRIDWITKKASLEVLANNPSIENILLLDDFNKFQRNSYELIISLDDEENACSIATKLGSKRLVGAYIHNGKRTYTEDSAPWFDMGVISKYGKSAADKMKAKNSRTYQEIMYQILNLKFKKQEPVLRFNEDEMQFGKNFAKKNGITDDDLVIGINTGAGGRWQDKKLSITDTVKLIQKIITLKRTKIILFGGPEEKERNQEIISIVGPQIIDAGCDNSLLEFASLINLCKILVTSDSLAMHIGISLKKYIVSFFYPTSAAEIELYGRGIKIIGEGRDLCSYRLKCEFPPKWDIKSIFDATQTLLQK
jgi:heptosyltransferase II